MSGYKARYEIRVCQGNYVARQIRVTVVAGNASEARRKALALVSVHDPVVVIDKITEVVDEGLNVQVEKHIDRPTYVRIERQGVVIAAGYLNTDLPAPGTSR